MAKKAKFGSTLLKVIALLLVIFVLVGAFMIIRKLSNNFTDDIKTFYVVVDGKTITNDTTNMSLLEKKIEVHSLSADRAFTYKIVAKQSRDFYFTANGVEYAFADKSDYTDSFIVEKTDSALKIASIGLLDVLNGIYKTDVELPHLNTETCYFTLIVTSADGSKSISMDFFVEVPEILSPTDGIYLDTTEIVF